MHLVEQAGFDSIDSMATHYYTAEFAEFSSVRHAQRLSRARRLRSLLASLHGSHRGWSERERTGYREEISRAAESLYAEELRELPGAMMSGSGGGSGGGGGGSGGSGASSSNGHQRAQSGGLFGDGDTGDGWLAETKRADIAQKITEVLTDEDTASFLRKDTAAMQDSVCLHLPRLVTVRDLGYGY